MNKGHRIRIVAMGIAGIAFFIAIFFPPPVTRGDSWPLFLFAQDGLEDHFVYQRLQMPDYNYWPAFIAAPAIALVAFVALLIWDREVDRRLERFASTDILQEDEEHFLLNRPQLTSLWSGIVASCGVLLWAWLIRNQYDYPYYQRSVLHNAGAPLTGIALVTSALIVSFQRRK